MPHITPFSKTELEGEKWKTVVEFPWYDVSNLGRIRSWRNKKDINCGPHCLKTSLANNDRFRISPRKNGKAFHRHIYRLVLETFIGPCPEGMEGCHNDDNHWNDRLWNLRWDTQAANSRDQQRNGKQVKGEQHWASILTEKQVVEIRQRYANGEKAINLAKEFGVAKVTIIHIKSGKLWKSVGGPTYNQKITRGELNGHAKLTENQIREIRERHKNGQSMGSLSRTFPASLQNISRIVHRKTWKHVV